MVINEGSLCNTVAYPSCAEWQNRHHALQSYFHEWSATSYAMVRCDVNVLSRGFSSFQPKPCLLLKITLNRPLAIQILYRGIQRKGKLTLTTHLEISHSFRNVAIPSEEARHWLFCQCAQHPRSHEAQSLRATWTWEVIHALPSTEEHLPIGGIHVWTLETTFL